MPSFAPTAHRLSTHDFIRIRVLFPRLLKVKRWKKRHIEDDRLALQMTDEDVLDFIEECSEVKGRDFVEMRKALQSLGRHCGGLGKAVDADEQCISDWLSGLKESVTRKTASRYLGQCRFLFDYLVEIGLLTAGPIAPVSKNVVRKDATASRKRSTPYWRGSYDDAKSNGSESVLFLEEYIASKTFGSRYEDDCRRSLARLAKWVGGYDCVFACDSMEIDDFLRDLRRSGRDAAHAFGALKGYFAFAVDRGIIGENPMSRLTAPEPGRRPARMRLEHGDIVRLLEYSKSNTQTERGALAYALICLTVHEGLENADLAYLDVYNYQKDGDGSYLLMEGPRAGIVKLCAETVSALDRYLSYRWDSAFDEPLLAKRGPDGISRYRKKSLRNIKRKAMEEAGVYKKGASLIGSRNDLVVLGAESAEIAAEGLRRSEGSRAISKLLRELDLNRGSTFEERLAYGRLTRSDVVRGVLSREDIETALKSWPGVDVFDAIVRYDGKVALEPRNL